MNFLRHQTRIMADVYRAYRFLTVPEAVGKWCKRSYEVLERMPYEQVIWRVTGSDGVTLSLSFHLMKCASKTEYCTEIHVVTTTDAANLEGYKDEVEQLLEMLRVYFNKTWVILDTDLTASQLR